jgi:plastocyanin
MGLKRLGISALGALALALTAAGCFSPAQPKCQFKCGAESACPTSYACQSDGYCHLKSAPAGEICDFPPGTDGSVVDAAMPDGAVIDGAVAIDAAEPDAALIDAQVIDVQSIDALAIDAPECTTSAQCGSATRPICSALMCESCLMASDCTAKNAAFKACLPSGACAECDDESDCGASAPHCNLGTHTCTACSDDSSCSFRAATPVCADNGSGTCLALTPSNFAGCGSYTVRTGAGDSRDITFDNGNFTFLPNCMQVQAGQTVTWLGDFTMHPLRGAPGNPGNNVIPSTNTGANRPVTFTTPGFYGFHCNIHGAPDGSGMAGTIQVVP